MIKPSSSKEIDALVADLASERDVAREAAVARLAVIGGRAVARLTAAARTATLPARARVAALGALAAIRDARGADAARRLLNDPDADVAIAAIGLGRVFLTGPHGVDLVDRMTAVAVDETRPGVVRAQAVRALKTLPGNAAAPLLASLAGDRAPEVAAAAGGGPGPKDQTLAANLALEAGVLPDDASVVRRAMSHSGEAFTLQALHQLIERIREREGAERGVHRAEWMAARAAIHAALASRHSRLGVYDLRESLESAATPLPVEMLSALASVGDGSCLEPIAGAWTRVPDDWWRRHLADAFQAIVARERITKRNAAVAKIQKRWPEALAALWPGTTEPRKRNKAANSRGNRSS